MFKESEFNHQSSVLHHKLGGRVTCFHCIAAIPSPMELQEILSTPVLSDMTCPDSGLSGLCTSTWSHSAIFSSSLKRSFATSQANRLKYLRLSCPLSMRDTTQCICPYLGSRVEGLPVPLSAPAVGSGFAGGVQTASKLHSSTSSVAVLEES